jgi:hypothetical protein
MEAATLAHSLFAVQQSSLTSQCHWSVFSGSGDVLALQSHADPAYNTKIHGCLFRIGETSTIPASFQPLSGNTRGKMLVRLKGRAHRHGLCRRGSGTPAESC